MLRRYLNAKIHRATVTAADLNYVGSISVDPALLEIAGIAEYECVTVLNITNGQRFDTYAMLGHPCEITLNGAAARRVQVGDLVILLTWVDLETSEAAAHEPVLVFVDEHNRPIPDPRPGATGLQPGAAHGGAPPGQAGASPARAAPVGAGRTP